MTKRKGLYKELEGVLEFYLYDDEDQAQNALEMRADRRDSLMSDFDDVIPQAPPGAKGLDQPDPADTQGELPYTEADAS